NKCGELRPMALAVEQRMRRDLSAGNGALLRRDPVKLKNIWIAPGALWRGEKVLIDSDRLGVQIKESVKRASGDLLPRRFFDSRQALGPAQFRAPNVAHKLL